MRRDLNKQYNRRLLIESALQLFCEKDYQKVTVEEIAHQAGVTKTTFFAHFRTKEEILVAIDVDQLSTFEVKLNSIGDRNQFIGDVVEAVVNMAQQLHRVPILTQNLIHLGTISPKYRKILVETFDKLKIILSKRFTAAQAQGWITQRVSADRIAEDFVIIYIGALTRWSYFTEPSPLQDILREVLLNYSRSIQAD